MRFVLGKHTKVQIKCTIPSLEFILRRGCSDFYVSLISMWRMCMRHPLQTLSVCYTELSSLAQSGNFTSALCNRIIFIHFSGPVYMYVYSKTCVLFVSNFYAISQKFLQMLLCMFLVLAVSIFSIFHKKFYCIEVFSYV